MYNHWDDHEFINDFSRAEFGGAIYDAGVKAFLDYMPVDLHAPANGLYRIVPLGQNLEVFFLDERSFRSAKAQREPRLRQPGHRPAGPRARRCRSASATSSALIEPSLQQPIAPGVPRRAQRPGPHDARRRAS